MAVDIAQLLAFAVKNNASDLHLSAGVPPMIRVDGDMKRVNMPSKSSTRRTFRSKSPSWRAFASTLSIKIAVPERYSAIFRPSS